MLLLLIALLSPPVNVDPNDAVARAVDQLQQAFDAKNGGFGGAPKLPLAPALDFLLRSGVPPARDMALQRLRAMANGAIHDQIGGGFHRISTDAEWRQPHYEKTLTAQVLLAIDYLEAWQLTRDPQFESVARDTLDYVLEIRVPGGGFASSENASSLVPGKSGPELVEGAYYLWGPDQLRFLFKDADAAARYYGIDQPRSLPYVADPFTDITTIRAKMKKVRDKRTKPALDMTVNAGANGLAISALARAGAAFGERRYLDGAKDAAKVIRTKFGARASSPAVSERPARSPNDYAFVIAGMLDLFEATGDVSLLEFAVTLQNKQDALFWNESESRYENGGDAPETALPTASSVSASNLLRLGEFTNSDAWRDRARSVFRGYGAILEREPSKLPAMVAAITMTLATPRLFVIAGNPLNPDTKALLRAAHERFVPFRIIVPLANDASRQRLANYLPFVKEMKPVEKKARAWVCEHYDCKLENQ